jgi:hypothetical protein
MVDHRDGRDRVEAQLLGEAHHLVPELGPVARLEYRLTAALQHRVFSLRPAAIPT